AQNNFPVNLIDVSQPQLEKALSTIEKNLDRQLAKNTISTETKNTTLANIASFTSIERGVSQCDLVIEAATENESIKLKIFKELDALTPAGCILASNTSSISITKIASATQRPEKVIGMH